MRSASPTVRADEMADALTVLNRIATSREVIRSTHVRVRITTVVDTSAVGQELIGAKREYSIWMDAERIRVDLDEERPNNPADALHKKMCFADGIYRIIPGGKNVAVQELYDAESDRRAKGNSDVNYLWTDPRILGLFPQSFAAQRMFELSAWPQFVARIREATVQADDERIIRLQLVVNPGADKYEITVDAEQGGMPTKVYRRAKWPSRGPPFEIEDWLETTWAATAVKDDDASAWLPAHVDYFRNEDGKLTLHERWEFTVSQVNEPLSDSLFTWEGMELWRDAVLIRGEDRKEIVQYDGMAFGPWKPVLAETLTPAHEVKRELPPAQSRKAGWIVVFVNLAALVVLIAYFAIRKTNPKS